MANTTGKNRMMKSVLSTLLHRFIRLECNILFCFFFFWSFKLISSAYCKAQTENKRVHMTSVLCKEHNRIRETVAFLVEKSPCSLFMKLGLHLTIQESALQTSRQSQVEGMEHKNKRIRPQVQGKMNFFHLCCALLKEKSSV